MPKKNIIDKLVEEDKLIKFAQETNEIDQATADRQAWDIFDRLFDEEIKRLFPLLS